MERSEVFTVLVVLCSLLHGISATDITVGFVSCEEGNAQFDRFSKYFNAALNKETFATKPNVEIRSLSISIRRPNQKRAEKMIQDVETFKTENGAALVGCWVRDTKIVLPEAGYPYFTYLPLFPDYVDKLEGKTLQLNRRKDKLTMTVTTLTPPINAFARPVMQYLKNELIKKAVVLVVGAESQLQFGDGLKDSVDSDDLDLVYVRLTKWAPKRDVKSALIGIRTKKIPTIIVHSNNLDVIKYIIIKARELNMMTSHYVWYFTYPDFDGLITSMSETYDKIKNDSLVVGMQLIDRSVFTGIGIQPKPEEIIEDAFYYDAATILVKALKFNDGQPKLTNTLLEDYVRTELIKDEKFSGALGRYGKFLLAPDENKGRMVGRVSGPMKWKAIYYRQQKEVGESNIKIADVNADLVVETPQDFKMENTNDVDMPNFNMGTLKVVAKLDPPLIMYNASENPQYRGVMVDLMDQYAKILNVNYTITHHVYSVENYGFNAASDQETIVDYLREGKADIAVGAFGSNLQRAEIISFTDTTIPCAVSLMMKAPKLEYSIFQFVTPFQPSMWLSIFVVFIVVSILLTVMDILDWTDENFPVRDSFYYVAGVLLSGTTDTNPASFPSRMLVGCFIFFAIVTFQSYTANMAAFLTTRDEFQGIPKTLYDVATRTSKTVIAINNSEIVSILKKAKKDPYNQIYTRLELVSDPETAVRLSGDNNHVLISDTSFTEYFTAQNCSLMDKEQDADTIRYAMAIPFGAEYRGALNYAIGKLKTKGEDRTIIKNWYKQPLCQSESGNSGGNLQTKSLTMGEMLGIFLTLGAGFILSLIVAIVGELLVRFYWKKPGTNFFGVFGYFAKIPGRLVSIISVWTNAGRRRQAQRKQQNNKR